MSIIDSLAEAFLQSFEDKFLSKSERDALRMLVEEAQLDQRKRDVLRSKVFDIVIKAAKDSDTRFGIEWLEAATRVLEAKAEGQEKGSKAFFSPGEDCYRAIVGEIGMARQRVDVCVFTISDNRISDSLIAQHRRGIRMRILTDNEKLNDLGSDIEMLAKAGLEIKVDRTDAHMHHKFAIVDGTTLINGSYNWTKSAADFNEENILVTREKSLVQQYQKEFDQLWERMERY